MAHEHGLAEIEQRYKATADWARGAQWADPEQAATAAHYKTVLAFFDAQRPNLDFWRGAMDGGRADITLDASGQLALEWKAPAHFLAAFLFWTYRQNTKIDARGSLIRQARAGKIHTRNVTARDIVAMYWPNDSVVTTESHRKAAKAVRLWQHPSPTESRKQRLQEIVSKQLLSGLRRPIDRTAHLHDLAGVFGSHDGSRLE